MRTMSKSRNTTGSKKTVRRKLDPVHPGEILREDYLKPLGLSGNRLALGLRVPATRITAILNEERSISADTAIRLARYFPNTTARFWLNLQTDYDLEVAQDRFGKLVAREVRAHDDALPMTG